MNRHARAARSSHWSPRSPGQRLRDEQPRLPFAAGEHRSAERERPASATGARAASSSSAGSSRWTSRPSPRPCFIEDGTVAAVGTRDEVLALAGDQVPIVDIGQNVAYPGFIDAHAHWIGDREYYAIETPAEAMDAAVDPRLDLDQRAVGQPGAARRAQRPRRRRRPAASRRRLPRPELRRRVPRGLVRRPRARAGRRPPPRPGAEDPPRRRLGHDHQLGARGPHRHDRPGERGRLAGVGPQHELRGAGTRPRCIRGCARPDRAESTPPPDRACRPGDRRGSWPAWSRWTSLP